MLTAGKIARLTGIPRATVYRYLKALMDANLISPIIRDNRTLYPDSTLDLVKKLYELVKITGSVEGSIQALKSGIPPAPTDFYYIINSLEQRMKNLESLLEGFISHFNRRIDELEERLSKLEPLKGLPSPEHGKRLPWWRRIFHGRS